MLPTPARPSLEENEARLLEKVRRQAAVAATATPPPVVAAAVTTPAPEAVPKTYPKSDAACQPVSRGPPAALPHEGKHHFKPIIYVFICGYLCMYIGMYLLDLHWRFSREVNIRPLDQPAVELSCKCCGWKG